MTRAFRPVARTMKHMNATTQTPYRRPSIAGWLAPTLLAPWLAMTISVAVYGALAPLHELIPRTAFVIFGLIIGALWATVYALVTALLDLALLVTRLRTLPNGLRAWLGSFLAPLAALASYAAYSPHKWYKFGPWAIVAALAVPLGVSTVAGRIRSGTKP